MKKYGFSLAEVLITLAILGVVAVMTIPNLNTNARREANAKKFGVIVSAVENALSAGIIAEGGESLNDVQLLSSLCDTNSGLVKYLENSGCSGGTVITMKNGATLTFTVNGPGVNLYGHRLVIDVDGKNGRGENLNDSYTVSIQNDGLITAQGDTLKLMQNGFRMSSIQSSLNKLEKNKLDLSNKINSDNIAGEAQVEN